MSFESSWNGNISAAELTRFRLAQVRISFPELPVVEPPAGQSIYSRRRQLKAIEDEPEQPVLWWRLATKCYNKLTSLLPRRKRILSAICARHRRITLIGRKLIRNFPGEYCHVWYVAYPQHVR